MTVMAISEARNNAELMVECEKLGYLHEDLKTVDLTYGLGRFWTLFRPKKLVGCDIDLDRSPCGLAVDFRRTLFFTHEFDVCVFDPPYKLNGTGGSHASDDSYGVANSVSWQDRHALIRDGLNECHRITKPGGVILVKCQDQVCSGKVRWQTMEFSQHLIALGAELVDMLHLVSYRAQPENRRQVHARRNYSTLMVFRRK